MSTVSCASLRVADGPANMALDEALLEAAAARRVGLPAHLRLDDADAEPGLLPADWPRSARIRVAGCPVVRRLTGGGAIWHHHEVTYAVVVPPSHRWPPEHGALSGRARGDRGSWRSGRSGPPTGEVRPIAGIATGTSVPLLYGPRSGGYRNERVTRSSAVRQRRRGGAVLQHGSILLARSPDVPSCLVSAMWRTLPRCRRTGRTVCWQRIPAALDLHPWPSACPIPCETRARAAGAGDVSQPGLDAVDDERRRAPGRPPSPPEEEWPAESSCGLRNSA